jgi:hypothetical protein
LRPYTILISYEDLGAAPLEDNGDTRFSIFLFDYYQHSFQKKIFVHSQRGRSPLIFVIKNIPFKRIGITALQSSHLIIIPMDIKSRTFHIDKEGVAL